MSRRPSFLSLVFASSCALLSTTLVSQAPVAAPLIPLVFEQNAGQLPAADLFAGRTQQYTLELRANQMRFAFASSKQATPVTISFDHTRGGQPQPLTETAFRSNFYLGNDPSQWHTNVHNYDRVALRSLYPGIDAQFYAHNNEIEHDFYIGPSADAEQLSMSLAGAASVKLSSTGDVLLAADSGAIRLHKPIAYQLGPNGDHQPVDARFILTPNGHSLHFALGAYDHTRTLVIDPVITYATYVSGTAGSVPAAITTDASGNVYLMGYTYSPIAGYAAASTNAYPNGFDATSSVLATFIAKLASADSGSKISWLTYFGSTTASVISNALAINTGGSTLYIGGQTTATNIPGTGTGFTTFDHTPTSTSGSILSFVSSFVASTGTFGLTTYVEGTPGSEGTTIVSALTVDTSGNVIIAGETTGSTFPTTTNALPISSGVINNTYLLKGLILKLDSTLTTESYGSYIAGDNANTTTNTTLTGVAVDASGNIYLSGATYGDFPQAGLYATAAMNTPSSSKTGESAFACQLIPSSKTLGWVWWSGDSANDIATGITLDANGNAYIYGETQSTNFVANNSVTTTSTATGTRTTPLDANYPTSASIVGFLAKVDNAGTLITSTFLGAPGLTNSAVYAGAVDASGNVYLSGSTNGVKAAFPQQTSGVSTANVSGATGLPVLEDLSTDSTAGSTYITRGFLLEMPSGLSSITNRSYFGPSEGTDRAIGLALDSATNAYVLLQELPSTGGASFATASAAQPAPIKADGNTNAAVVAKVSFATASSSASLTVGTNSFTPTVVGYASATNYSILVLTWKITGAASGATTVVFNLPYSQYLSAYTLASLTLNGTALPTGTCTLGTASVANTKPGITCILPSLAAGATDTFVLTRPVTSAVATAAATLTSITILAAAFDAQGDNLNLSQTAAIAKVPTLTLTDTVSVTTAYAANSTTDTTTPNTAVTYTYTIKNTSANDSPHTKLILALDTTNVFTSITATSSTGCDPTTATNGCDVAANGTLTYTVKGVYLDGQYSAAGPYAVSNAAPTLSYTPITNAATVTGTTTALTVNIYLQAQTINFTPTTPVVYTPSGTITLSATASSGLAVGFALGANSPATISGNILTLTGTGTITVSASQNGAYNYAPATTVTKSIVVSKGSQSITFTPPTTPITYAPNETVNLAATSTSSLAVTFTLGTGSPATISGNTLTITGAGTVVVYANQAGNTLYNAATQVSQTIVVNKAAQIITFPQPATPITYAANETVTLAATSDSGLAVTYTLGVGSPATISGNLLTITGIGTITATASQAGNTSYNAATAVSQTIVVSPGPQTITFAALTSPVNYGVSPITLSATSTSGLTVTFSINAGAPATLSGNTLTVTGVGSVVVTASQSGNTYYSAATPVSQTLVVNKAIPTITWSPTSPIAYGASFAPVFNAIASVPGTFAYTTGSTTLTASTVLPAGTYPIIATFTPTNTSIYATTSANASLVITRVAAVVTIACSANPTLFLSPITFTATVPTAATGYVSFLDSGAQIGSGTIVNGVATFSTASLAAATHTITAMYTGDSNFISASSSAITEVVADFALGTGAGTSSTNVLGAEVHRGQTANFSVAFAPTSNTFPAAITFALTGAPAGATVSFTPSTITAGSGATTLAIAVAVPSTLAQLERNQRLERDKHLGRDLAPVAFALLLLPFAARRRSARLRRLLIAILLFTGLAAGITGCGASGPTPETYTMNLTATSGTLTHTTTLTLIVD